MASVAIQASEMTAFHVPYILCLLTADQACVNLTSFQISESLFRLVSVKLEHLSEELVRVIDVLDHNFLGVPLTHE